MFKIFADGIFYFSILKIMVQSHRVFILVVLKVKEHGFNVISYMHLFIFVCIHVLPTFIIVWGCWIALLWGHRRCELLCGCWNLNPGNLIRVTSALSFWAISSPPKLYLNWMYYRFLLRQNEKRGDMRKKDTPCSCWLRIKWIAKKVWKTPLQSKLGLELSFNHIWKRLLWLFYIDFYLIDL